MTSSELQTELSVEVRPESADPSGPKPSSRNMVLSLVSFTAVDFQLFLGLYKRLYVDCRMVVRLSVLHVVFKVCGLWLRRCCDVVFVLVQVLQDSDASHCPEERLGRPAASKVRF